MLLEAGALIGQKMSEKNLMPQKDRVQIRLRAENPGFLGWSVYSFIGLVEGAMGAFPDGSRMDFCNDDTQEMKEDFESGITEFNSDYDTTGAEYFYKAFQMVGHTYNDCYWGYRDNSNSSSYSDLLPFGILWNMLYNAGFIFVDIIKFFHLGGQYPTTDEILPYYYFYYMGDFGMRFIYRVSNA